MAQLLLTQANGHTELRAVEAPAMTLGRAMSNQLVLDSPHASRQHAVIESQGPFCSVRDLGSLNRTFVNGCQVDAQVLAHGDVITIGDCQLVFNATDQERVPDQVVRDITERGLLY